MLITLFKSKIHRATVTETNLNYEGSITIDAALMEAAAIRPYERVQVVNNHNGMVFETYAVPGKKNSGTICLNGAAARMGQAGDTVILLTYAMVDDEEIKNWHPTVIHVDQHNLIRR
ncbi:hypothetical protein SY88_20945 [Clostridiales bacterium PH28_bin88]|nr:hypothetical protein SY88_20945 [Clostridiales bacterium PH28_bin88]